MASRPPNGRRVGGPRATPGPASPGIPSHGWAVPPPPGGGLDEVADVDPGHDGQVARDRLRQAHRMRLFGDLAPGLAHELNNPLTAILAFSQLLQADPRLPADLRADALLLAQEADRTQRLIRTALEFARHRPPERASTDVRVLVESVLALATYALSRSRIDVDVRIEPELPPIEIDRSDVQHVLLDLTVNAIQAIDAVADGTARGRLEIAAESVGGEHPGRVRISVTDDGPGMATGSRRIMLTPPGPSFPAGPGLGLMVASDIVGAHGGRLWHEPGPSGNGTRFVVELPVSAAAREETRATSPGDPRPPLSGLDEDHGARVLVIDDEATIRKLIDRALRSRGSRSRLASDGDEGLALLRHEPFDVLLVDHRMAGMDGLEFRRRAVNVRPEVAGRVILMSGDVMDPELQGAVESGLARVLAKPFELDAVARAIDEVVTSKGRANG